MSYPVVWCYQSDARFQPLLTWTFASLKRVTTPALLALRFSAGGAVLNVAWPALFIGLFVETSYTLLALVLIGANVAVIRTSNTFAFRVGLELLLALNAFVRNSAHSAVFTTGRTFILWINGVPCLTRQAFANCRARETVWRAFHLFFTYETNTYV